MTAELATARLTLEQPQQMAADVVEAHALGETLLDVGAEGTQRIVAAGVRILGLAVQLAVHRRQQPGVVVRLTADHHAIDVLQLLVQLVHQLQAAIDTDMQGRVRLLEAVHAAVVQRRHIAVLLRRQALQPRLARMHAEGVAAGIGHGGDEALEIGVLILIIDPDAALHRHRNLHLRLHRRHALGHQLRMAHQTGTDHVVLHAIARAADIQVHLVIAPALGDRRTLGQRLRVTATQLQRQRMLRLVVTEEALAVRIEQQCPGGHHLRVQQRTTAQHAREGAVVTGRPFHHRRNGKGAVNRCHRHGSHIGWCGSRDRSIRCRRCRDKRAVILAACEAKRRVRESREPMCRSWLNACC